MKLGFKNLFQNFDFKRQEKSFKDFVTDKISLLIIMKVARKLANNHS